MVRSSATKGDVAVGDIGPDTKWGEACRDVDCVIHLAGRAHVQDGPEVDGLSEFIRVNAQGTSSLAREAAAKGVRRPIFISSIGVNGNSSAAPFTEEDPPAPVEPYAVSKLQAETVLREICAETGMEVVIIRPPLVYGANAPGNFGLLVKALARQVPLPLGAVKNRRSFVAIDNLVDLILICIDHPAAANQVFLVGDGEDLSTTELLVRLGDALGTPARLLPVPQKLMSFGLRVLGKTDLSRRLFGSLQVDITMVRNVLGWSPPVSVDEGLRRAGSRRVEVSIP